MPAATERALRPTFAPIARHTAPMRYVKLLCLTVTLGGFVWIAALWSGLIAVADPFFVLGASLLYAGWIGLLWAGLAIAVAVRAYRRTRPA